MARQHPRLFGVHNTPPPRNVPLTQVSRARVGLRRCAPLAQRHHHADFCALFVGCGGGGSL